MKKQAIEAKDQPGLHLWQVISAEESYKSIPPLPRFIQYVRDTCHTKQELLNLSFSLCEANLQITDLEFNQWQGLAVIDATGVFSAQGLGYDLCSKYELDFPKFLKTLGQLAADSEQPAQYHQCINQNIFSSPFNDAVMISRLESLSSHDSPACLGWIPVSSAELQRLATTAHSEIGITNDKTEIEINPQRNPYAYRAYGRSLAWSMDGNINIKSPFCCNVWLEINGTKPLHWLCSVDVQPWLKGKMAAQGGTVGFSSGILELEYQCDLCEEQTLQLRLLASAEAPGYEDPGRAPVHYWIHQEKLPLKAANRISIKLHATEWRSLKGTEAMAYGRKCLREDFALLNQQPPRLILALEAANPGHVPQGRISLPRISLKDME